MLKLIRQKLSTTLLVAALLSLSSFAFSDNSTTLNTLTPYSATYQSTIKGINATIKRELKSTAKNQWLLSNNASILFGGISEQSLMQDAQGQLKSLHYNYKNDFSSKRNSQLLFNWDEQTVIDKKSDRPAQQFKGPAYDKLSFQAQLRRDAMSGKLSSTSTTYQVIDRHRIKHYQVRAIGKETIMLPSGRYNAIKLEQTRVGKDKSTHIWLAKDWQYLILKLEQFEGGKSISKLELDKASIAGRAVTALPSSH